MPLEFRRILIACGAETQKLSAPGVTEANLIMEYIIRKAGIKIKPNFLWYLEEDSYTTLDNIRNAKDRIKKLNIDLTNTEVVIVLGYGAHLTLELERYLDGVVEHLSETEIQPGITIRCESSRMIKVRIISLWFLHRWIRIRTAELEKRRFLFQTLSTLGEIAALFVPGLAAWGRNKRIQHSFHI